MLRRVYRRPLQAPPLLRCSILCSGEQRGLEYLSRLSQNGECSSKKQEWRGRLYSSSTLTRSVKDDFKETLRKVKADIEEGSAAKKNEKAEDTDKSNTTDQDNDKSTTKFTSFEGAAAGIDPKEMAFKTWDFILKSKSAIQDNIKLAWEEMTATSSSAQKSTLERKVVQAATFKRAEAPPPPKSNNENENLDIDNDGMKKENAGSGAIVVVKEAKSAWEQMKARLQDSPLIREFLKSSKHAGKVASQTDVGKQAIAGAQNIRDKLEDAREFWETSQNPLVYTLSGVWDNLTGETEEGVTIAEIRKLDPNFLKEDFINEVRNTLATDLIKAHLGGDLSKIKDWLGEALYRKLAADIRERKGYTFDTNILFIEENQVQLRRQENGMPYIVVVYSVQQINCIRDKAGEIKEGNETEVRMKFYSMAFQQSYEETEGTVKWKVIEYLFVGDVPYY